MSTRKANFISLDLAKSTISGLVSNRKLHVSLEKIAEETAVYYNIPLAELKDRSRRKEIALARQVAMYACHRLTRHSLRMIALHFGRRDHSTVIHAVKTIKKNISNDPIFAADIEDIVRTLEQGS